MPRDPTKARGGGCRLRHPVPDPESLTPHQATSEVGTASPGLRGHAARWGSRSDGHLNATSMERQEKERASRRAATLGHAEGRSLPAHSRSHTRRARRAARKTAAPLTTANTPGRPRVPEPGVGGQGCRRRLHGLSRSALRLNEIESRFHDELRKFREWHRLNFSCTDYYA